MAQTNRPDLVAPVSSPEDAAGLVYTSSFANPLAPWNGGEHWLWQCGKRCGLLPGLFNWNLALFKNIPLTSW